ncbi:MAG: hypothetical protein JRI68_11275 [Deltaproteobacteria bacterium]|nr:hypothetical protein [Deltaproteobacteria bacterium]
MVRKGRILRLKLGYNPNSSSIGTIVFAMPAALLGSIVAFGAVAGLVTAAALHRKGDGTEADSNSNSDSNSDSDADADPDSDADPDLDADADADSER